MWIIILLLFTTIPFSSSINNGLGLVPPMGWLSWLRYRCTTNCEKYPNDCISEKLIMQMADQMSTDFKDAGYQYVMIDDCWLANSRAPNNSLLPDPSRFPRGIKFLSDYVHQKGLKFGIYEDYGYKTCAGYPGSLGYLKIDAFTFASWGVDYVKFDGCNSNPSEQPIGVQNFSIFLNQTGRPIFLNVEWPWYIGTYKVTAQEYMILENTTNMARVFNDIEDNWNSLASVIDFYKQNVNDFASWAKPGHFNDPDMLLIGNNYINNDQEQLQMTMWAIFAAPLIMSNDLRNISGFSKSILTNKNIIAINQDPLGIQGRYIKTISSIQFWIRPLVNNRLAIAIVNMENKNINMMFSLQDLNITEDKVFLLTEVYYMKIKLKILVNTKIKFSLKPTSGMIYYCEKI